MILVCFIERYSVLNLAGLDGTNSRRIAARKKKSIDNNLLKVFRSFVRVIYAGSRQGSGIYICTLIVISVF